MKQKRNSNPTKRFTALLSTVAGFPILPKRLVFSLRPMQFIIQCGTESTSLTPENENETKK